jgi:hypothetical protein
MHDDVLDEPGTVRGDTDRLTTAPPVRGVHDGPPYSGDQRDGRQFYQSFLLERELDALGDALAEPQRVDQLVIRDTLARVACTALVELVEERYSLRLHRFTRHHGGLLGDLEGMRRSTGSERSGSSSTHTAQRYGLHIVTPSSAGSPSA